MQEHGLNNTPIKHINIQSNILEVRKSKVRPAFLLSVIKNPKTPKEMKIRVQVYIHEEIKNFPLAHRD